MVGVVGRERTARLGRRYEAISLGGLGFGFPTAPGLQSQGLGSGCFGILWVFALRLLGFRVVRLEEGFWDYRFKVWGSGLAV